MTTEAIKALHEEMKGAWTTLQEKFEEQATEIKKAGEARGETQTVIERLQTRLDTLEEGIKAAQRPGLEIGTTQTQDGLTKAFDLYLRHGKSGMGPEELKALSSSSDPDGGIFVTPEFRNQLITKLRDLCHIRSRATVITTTAGSVTFPTFDYDGDADWMPEKGAYTEEPLANLFGKYSFTPHKLGRLFKVPQELIDDSAVDITSLIINHFGQRFAEIEENHFLNGTGNSQPLGLLSAGLTTRNKSGAGVFADTDLVDMTMDIRGVYRQNACWMMHRNAIRAVRKMKDGQGMFIWQPGIQAGQPSTILSFPVIESEFFPDKTAAGNAGDPLVLFGDLSHYWIVDRQDVSVQQLTELYAANDQIGYKLKRRMDAAPVRKDPFVVLVRV